MSLIAIAILNALLGVSCGALFRVTILIPLIAIACVEMAILKMTGLWPSPIWSAFVLFVLIDTGYLIGASMAPLLTSSVLGEMLQGFAMRFRRRGLVTPCYGRMPAIDEAGVTQTSQRVA